MALFNRKKDTTQVPQEVQDYYQSARRERVGVAWLLALGTLVVTIILATTLFLGGRWAYRKIANRDKATNSQTNQQEAPQDSGKPGENTTNSTDSETPPPSTNPTPTPTTPTTSQGTSSTSTSRPNNPAVGGAQTTLPNTGPDEDL